MINYAAYDAVEVLAEALSFFKGGLGRIEMIKSSSAIVPVLP